MNTNIITLTDSYKIGGHWNMLLPDTEVVHSYFEARMGAEFDNVVFFGLQYILKEKFEGVVVTQEKIDKAAELCKCHFGSDTAFNRAGWQYILDKHHGRLPLSIKAAPEGSVIPINNVLFTVENTDEKCAWLTSYVESVLSHVWAPSTVATYAFECKKMLKSFWELGADHFNGLDFQLHGFGYRSVSSDESAALLDCAPLLFFKGTDTVPALEMARDYYSADLGSLAFSVPASEHTLQTSLGKEGESDYTRSLIKKYPKGILSIVADTYSIYNFVDNIAGVELREDILNRDGVTVIRPDSITSQHSTPESLTLWILESLGKKFGYSVNSKGYKVLNPKLKVLWGDGIDKDGIYKILHLITDLKWSPENLVFGMGGNYIQKGIYRDRQRFAFKCSAQKRAGKWHDIQKDPLDKSKTSKRGRLKLIKENGEYKTVREEESGENLLVECFRNGVVVTEYSFENARVRAQVC
jgi:nicotinamide phosphoribosyltransferase